MWWFFKRDNSEIIAKAIKENDLSKVKKYVNSDNVNNKSCDGLFPLHLAAKYAGSELVKYLLDKGANCKNLTEKGESSLLLAVKAGNLEVVKTLLDNTAVRATIDWYSVEGENPLSFAFISGDKEMAKLLREYNPNVDKARISGCGELEARLEFVKNFPEAPEQCVQDPLQQSQGRIDILGVDRDVDTFKGMAEAA